jgi:hypothetical protein
LITQEKKKTGEKVVRRARSGREIHPEIETAARSAAGALI